MRITTLLTALLLIAQVTQAATLNPQDFAKGYELRLRQQEAIHFLPLPDEVYTTVTQPSLGDIRVFNAERRSVPHLLKLETTAPERIESEVTLPFSPLYGFVQTGSVHRTETQIIRGPAGVSKGAAMSVVQTERRENEEKRKMNGYLIETEGIAAVSFRLQADVKAEKDLLATLTLESSDDLATWTSLGSETVASLHFQGHLIEKKFDRSIARRQKYLRLSWPISKPDVVVEQVRAITYTGKKPWQRNWTTLRGKHIEAENEMHTSILEFDSHGFLPVDLIRIAFPKPNSLIQATISSRPTLNSAWHTVGAKVFYDIRTGGAVLRDDTIAIARTTDRYWRLEIAAEQDIAADSSPLLLLGWTPHKLYFLSQGTGPFLLTFGNGSMPATVGGDNGKGLEVLLRNIEKQNLISPPVEILNKIELGGPARLIPPQPATPWKKWLLWTVLISGVLTIGAMAHNLYRQMREKEFE